MFRILVVFCPLVLWTFLASASSGEEDLLNSDFKCSFSGETTYLLLLQNIIRSSQVPIIAQVSCSKEVDVSSKIRISMQNGKYTINEALNLLKKDIPSLGFSVDNGLLKISLAPVPPPKEDILSTRVAIDRDTKMTFSDLASYASSQFPGFKYLVFDNDSKKAVRFEPQKGPTIENLFAQFSRQSKLSMIIWTYSDFQEEDVYNVRLDLCDEF